MAQSPLLAVAWSAFVLAALTSAEAATSTTTQQGDEFQVPTLVDPDCHPQAWDGVVCEISCNVGYESACLDIRWERICRGWFGLDGCTETGMRSCSQLGPGFSPVSSEGGYNRHGYLLEDQKCCRCQLPQAPGRAWEFVGGPFNRACRGRGYGDNSPSDYTVFPGTSSLADCQGICVRRGSRCKGVEYSTRGPNAGRCEVWHRPEGLWAYAEPAGGNFTCMRYGWPAQYLKPVDTGVNRACRGDHPTDNNDQYYVVHEVMHMEDCRARCVAAPACFGIEYKGNRCEVWIRPINASSEVEGFTCLRYEAPRRLLSLI